MKIEKLEESLPRMPNRALFRFVKRCICRTLSGLAESKAEAKNALDVVYLECQRRGQERLYDLTYESVSRHPEQCNIA